MKTNIFDFFEPISATRFLSTFELLCDQNGVHVGAAIQIFHVSVEKPAAAALTARIALSSNSYKRQKDKQGPVLSKW